MLFRSEITRPRSFPFSLLLAVLSIRKTLSALALTQSKPRYPAEDNGQFLCGYGRHLRNVALSARITEDEFYSQKEAFEPTGVLIFLAQKASGKYLLLLFPLFGLYLTLLALNFFPIFYVLSLHRPARATFSTVIWQRNFSFPRVQKQNRLTLLFLLAVTVWSLPITMGIRSLLKSAIPLMSARSVSSLSTATYISRSLVTSA